MEKKQKSKEPTVLIAIPTMGTLRAELAQWTMKQVAISTMTVGITPHALARNSIMETFLETGADYLMMVDSDTLPPRTAILRMLKSAGENIMVTGVTPIIRGDKVCPNVYKTSADVEQCVKIEDEEPFEVVGCGASCLLIPRTLVDKLKRPFFKSIEFDDGKICSEDLYFCDKVREVGGKIICDPTVKCTHYKEIGLNL